MPEGSGFQYAYSKNKSGPIYISRPVLNNEEICQWYSSQGIETIDPQELHITIVYSKAPISWDKAFVEPTGLSIQANASRGHNYFPTKNGDEVMVIEVESPDLSNRHNDLKKAGCSHDYDSYKPHITIAKGHQAVPLDSIQGWPSKIWLGPEEYKDIVDDYYKSDPLIISFPAIIKAEIAKSGERIIEVQASCEAKDLEGDVILQKALLNSAPDFLKYGHIDIDHKSESPVANRLGITNPEYYIIGRPLEVKKGDNKSTYVKGEIAKSSDGSFDPEHRMADMVWDSLQRHPPVNWYASVYGWPIPGETKNCQSGGCINGATRWLIEGLNWKSLALTRHPVNTALKGAAEIITAKSWLDHIKGEMPYPSVPTGGLPTDIGPNSSSAVPSIGGLLAKGESCKDCGSVLKKAPSLAAWKRHLIHCSGYIPEIAELYSRAILYDRLLKQIGVD